MAHSNIKIWIHAIIGVKYRESVISNAIEQTVYDFLRREFVKCKCPLDRINGTTDHLHVLFLLNPDLTIRQAMKQVKGASSHSINGSKIFNNKFAWQVGIGAFSISESQVPIIRKYIDNQKTHHKKMTFEEEYRKFIKLYGLDEFSGNEEAEEE